MHPIVASGGAGTNAAEFGVPIGGGRFGPAVAVRKVVEKQRRTT
jgi:hypothetical protein